MEFLGYSNLNNSQQQVLPLLFIYKPDSFFKGGFYLVLFSIRVMFAIDNMFCFCYWLLNKLVAIFGRFITSCLVSVYCVLL